MNNNELIKENEKLKQILKHFGIPENYNVNQDYGRCKKCGYKLGPNNHSNYCGDCEW